MNNLSPNVNEALKKLPREIRVPAEEFLYHVNNCGLCASVQHSMFSGHYSVDEINDALVRACNVARDKLIRSVRAVESFNEKKKKRDLN